MIEILRYIGEYFRYVNKKMLTICTLQTAVLVFLNYHNQLEWHLSTNQDLGWPSFTGHFILFAIAFILPYFFFWIVTRKSFFNDRVFVMLMVIAPAIFSLKMALRTPLPFSNDPDWNQFWNQVYYWPVRLLIVVSILFIIWQMTESDQPFYGHAAENFTWKPYLVMVLCMVPLIVAASTQHDFLAMYPRLKSILHNNVTWLHKLLFELSYGSDFFGIEIFFRGFLVLGFIRWVGMGAILPMACFYCTIHFGKPLGECISSYFGGILLGIVVYKTRSIYGGLIVHLGIAWLMEIGGYLGNAMR